MLLNFFRNTPVENIPVLGAREFGGGLYYPGVSYEQNLDHILEFFAFVASQKIMISSDGSLHCDTGFNASKYKKIHWQDLGFDRTQVQMFFDFHFLEIDASKPPTYLPVEAPVDQYNTVPSNADSMHESYLNHTSEGIELVKDVIKQFWSTYCPEQKDTAPKKKDVIAYLTAQNVPVNLANAVDMVLRPVSLKTGGRPKSKAV